MNSKDTVIQRFKDSIAIKQQIINDESLIEMVCRIADELAEVIGNGNKLVLCGNGGSASDALHFAGEIVGRFQKERPSWPAIVLNADVSTITAIANDYGYEDVFAHQAMGMVREGDMFVGISTSGNSENVLRAAKVSKEKGAVTAALLGRDGGKLKNIVDYPVVVKCDNTARIQESHICVIHIICELVEEKLTQRQHE